MSPELALKDHRFTPLAADSTLSTLWRNGRPRCSSFTAARITGSRRRMALALSTPCSSTSPFQTLLRVN